MKKILCTLLAILMATSMISCGKSKTPETPDIQEPVTNTPDVNTEKDPTTETPAVTPNDNRYTSFLINESFSVDEDPNAYERYLECVNRNADAITFPLWGQFSALGTFRAAEIKVVKEAHHGYFGEGMGIYHYSYVDPDSGTERLYRAVVIQMEEGKEYTFQNRDDFPDVLGMGSDRFFKWRVVGYTSSQFEEGDFGRYKDDADPDMVIVDKTFAITDIYMNTCGYIAFIYNNYYVMIGVSDLVDGFDPSTDGFQRSLDCDIVCRLFHKDTYKEATQELMNPENAK